MSVKWTIRIWNSLIGSDISFSAYSFTSWLLFWWTFSMVWQLVISEGKYIFHQKCDRKVFTFMISHVNWNFGDYYVSLKITRGSGQFLSHFYRWNIVSYEQCKNVGGWNRHLSKHKTTKYHLVWNWCSWDKGITNISRLRLSISFRI